MPGMGVGIGLFLVLTVAEVVLLIGIIAGRPWLLFSLETTLSRVLPSFAFSYILVSHLAARELCSPDGGRHSKPSQRARAFPTPCRRPLSFLAHFSSKASCRCSRARGTR